MAFVRHLYGPAVALPLVSLHHLRTTKEQQEAMRSASCLCACAEPPPTTQRACVKVAPPVRGHGVRSTRNDTPIKVLIVGGGLTGCIVASRLRRAVESSSILRDREFHMDVWERASYPSGRFGAVTRFPEGSSHVSVADMGAQVLSTVNPCDPRALPGHGVRQRDLCLAWEMVQRLVRKGALVPVPNHALASTEERMNWEGLWVHHWAPRGMDVVLRSFLCEAELRHLRLSTRVTSITAADHDHAAAAGGRLCVQGQRRTEQGGKEPISEAFDVVVCCVPAPDALAIQGVDTQLCPQHLELLKRMRYDTRSSRVVFYDGNLRGALRETINSSLAELEFISEGHDLELLAIQDAKRNMEEAQGATPLAVVAHGKAGLGSIELGTVHRALSDHLNMPEATVALHMLHSREIPWAVAQMICPLEANVPNPGDGPECFRGRGNRNRAAGAERSPEKMAAESARARSGALYVTGDFMTQSSFLGCVAAAEACVEGVVKELEQERRDHAS